MKMLRTLCLAASLVIVTSQAAEAVRKLPIKKVFITLIKTKSSQDGTILYFKIDNNTGSDIDVATFECNIFDSLSSFSQIVNPSVRRVKSGDSAYAEEQIDLKPSQFGRADCRGIDAFAEE
jgi:hypothetical protein